MGDETNLGITIAKPGGGGGNVKFPRRIRFAKDACQWDIELGAEVVPGERRLLTAKFPDGQSLKKKLIAHGSKITATFKIWVYAPKKKDLKNEPQAAVDADENPITVTDVLIDTDAMEMRGNWTVNVDAVQRPSAIVFQPVIEGIKHEFVVSAPRKVAPATVVKTWWQRGGEKPDPDKAVGELLVGEKATLNMLVKAVSKGEEATCRVEYQGRGKPKELEGGTVSVEGGAQPRVEDTTQQLISAEWQLPTAADLQAIREEVGESPPAEVDYVALGIPKEALATSALRPRHYTLKLTVAVGGAPDDPNALKGTAEVAVVEPRYFFSL